MQHKRAIDTENSLSDGLFLLSRKSMMGIEKAERIELGGWLHFDTIRREKCSQPSVDFISQMLLTAALIGKKLKNKRFELLAITGYNAVHDGNFRDQRYLRLTTKEYLSVRVILTNYFQNLPAMSEEMVMESATNAYLIYKNDRVKIKS